MAGEKISSEVKRFIRSTINSAEQLEVLIFMMSNADKEWSADEVSSQTRLPVESTATKLQDLADADLLLKQTREDRALFRYSPNSDALANEVAESLEQAYLERRDTLLQLIYSKPLENIRIFSDSFRIRRDDD